MEIRPAYRSDLKEIMAVLEAAKGIMRASGNHEQWADGYPGEDVILEDIRLGNGFVMEATDEPVGDSDAKPHSPRIAAYFAFIPSPEPTYSEIFDGHWLDDTLPYHVVHRIGSYPHIHGIFSAIIDWCFTHDRNIRIDTHRDNLIMQHNLLKHGFTYCGIIYLLSGSPRLAYQRL